MTNLEQHPLNPGEAVPLFISAGVLKEPAQAQAFLDVEDPLMVPLLTFGSFTYDAWAGNAKAGQTDFVYYAEQQMAGNARGLPNRGREGLLALKEPIRRLSERGIKTMISITNLPHETPLDVIPVLAEVASEVNPTAIEINLSCPNGLKADGSLHEPLCNDPDASGYVIARTWERKAESVALGIKDSPHASSLESGIDEHAVTLLAERVFRLADFVTGINTIGGQPFPEIDCAGGRGGMSGPVVTALAKRHLQLWQQAAPELPYLSVGGVDSVNAGQEINERLKLGALRVGGAQEFYRARQPHLLAARWVAEMVAYR